MKRKLAAAATVVLVACAAAGCGDDKVDSGSAAAVTTASGAPPTKAAFVTAADAICTQTNTRIRAAAAKLRAAGQKSGTLPKLEVVKFLKEGSLPAYDDMVRQLSGLKAPAGDESALDAYVAAVAAAIDRVKANPAKFVSRTVADPFGDANKRARDYGMTVCGS